MNMEYVSHNLELLKEMKVGDIADFEDRNYPSILREDDGFYMLDSLDEYWHSKKYRSLMNLGPYFCFIPLTIRT